MVSRSYLYPEHLFSILSRMIDPAGKTHDNSHPGTLYQPNQKQHQAQYPPPTFHFLLATRNDHNIGDQRYALPDHGE